MLDSEIRIFKKNLRFVIGDVVHMASDKKRKTPMTIVDYCSPDEEQDYVVKWPNSQKTIETEFLKDSVLVAITEPVTAGKNKKSIK